MLSVKDLTAGQVESIKSWVADGAQMADVQKRLKEEFDLNVTYMDTRFLALDLGLDFETEDEPEEKKEADPTPESNLADLSSPTPESAAGEVSVTLDQVARPGAMVSGTVTFSDGVKGQWLIDEMGRPSIDPDQPGYAPSEADLMAFQEKLGALLEGHV